MSIKNLTIELTGKMPSLNEVIDTSRRNKFAGNRLKQEIQKDLEMQIFQQIRSKGIYENLPFENVVDFDIVYIEANAKRDKDNIASIKKFIFDALVSRGVLKNDTWKYVGNFTEKFIIGSDYKVIITMTERE